MRKWSEVTGFWQKLSKKEEAFSGERCHSSSCSPTEPSETVGRWGHGTLILGRSVYPISTWGEGQFMIANLYLLPQIFRPSYGLAPNVPWLLKGVKSWLLPNVSGAKKIPSGGEQKIEDKMKPLLVTLSSVSQ